MGPPQGRAEGKENLPRPAAHAPPNAPQDPIGLLGTQGTLLAHGHPVVPQDTRSLSAELHSSRSAPACTGAWGCSSPGAGPCICLCWTSSGSFLPNFLACPGHTEWQHSLLYLQVSCICHSAGQCAAASKELQAGGEGCCRSRVVVEDAVRLWLSSPALILYDKEQTAMAAAPGSLLSPCLALQVWNLRFPVQTASIAQVPHDQTQSRDGAGVCLRPVREALREGP